MVPERDPAATALNGLLPLRREYTQAWHGFDRNEVRQYLDHVEAQLRRVLSERDAAAAQAAAATREVEAVRQQVAALEARVEELKKPPERLEDLDERMQRTVTLAQARADEIIKRAEVAAEKTWASSTEASTKLRERYSKLVAELDKQADLLHSEHEAALAETRAEVQRLTVEAAQRRELLDNEAERKRRKLEREFEASQAAQKAALEKHIADQRTASKNQAERRLAEATAEAKRRLDEATAEAKRRLDEATTQAAQRTTAANRKVERLAEIREQARKSLALAEDILNRSETQLAALPEEAVIPQASRLVGGDSESATTPAGPVVPVVQPSIPKSAAPKPAVAAKPATAPKPAPQAAKPTPQAAKPAPQAAKPANSNGPATKPANGNGAKPLSPTGSKPGN
ncbi:coiled-coil domain-containing protein [Amycolatopsis rifamycinica]|uniref:Cell division protein DivIVA n=1 Tax=Amycolatopsis rifamycinica TaxID=287986 RepID=A0A066U1G7_9PSEU|nr:cell division protein DivIVA [Amycolatopsis rifamycinica]KDN20950.1 cell division protein DivIVA [Amycolatopsis rifamycinica]